MIILYLEVSPMKVLILIIYIYKNEATECGRYVDRTMVRSIERPTDAAVVDRSSGETHKLPNVGARSRLQSQRDPGLLLFVFVLWLSGTTSFAILVCMGPATHVILLLPSQPDRSICLPTAAANV